MPVKSSKKNKTPHHEVYRNELNERLTNPIHRRVLGAYCESDPVRAMEKELGEILLEVLEDED